MLRGGRERDGEGFGQLPQRSVRQALRAASICRPGGIAEGVKGAIQFRGGSFNHAVEYRLQPQSVNPIVECSAAGPNPPLGAGLQRPLARSLRSSTASFVPLSGPPRCWPGPKAGRQSTTRSSRWPSSSWISRRSAAALRRGVAAGGDDRLATRRVMAWQNTWSGMRRPTVCFFCRSRGTSRLQRHGGVGAGEHLLEDAEGERLERSGRDRGDRAPLAPDPQVGPDRFGPRDLALPSRVLRGLRLLHHLLVDRLREPERHQFLGRAGQRVEHLVLGRGRDRPRRVRAPLRRARECGNPSCWWAHSARSPC